MKQKTYKPIFNSKGMAKPVEWFVGNYVLINAHNRMAELTEGKYAEWNKEWDELHKNDDANDRLKEDPFYPEYVQFMNQKVEKLVIPKLNYEFYSMTFSMGDEHNLVGHLGKGTIDFALKEV